MANKPHPPRTLTPDSERLTNPQPRTGWSWASTNRAKFSEALGVDLEVWMRARILEGYTDRQMAAMLADICGYPEPAERTVTSWRADLGYRQGSRREGKIHQGPLPMGNIPGDVPSWARLDDTAVGPHLDLD